MIDVAERFPEYRRRRIKQPDRQFVCWEIPCRFGAVIRPFYGDFLMVVIPAGHVPTVNRLLKVEYVDIAGAAPGGAWVALTFPVEMFAEVAKIARPRKRRQISEEQRQAAKARFQASREQRKALAIPG